MFPFSAPAIIRPAVASDTGTTFNPSDKGSGVVLSNGNRTATGLSGGSASSVRTLKGLSTGKGYFEFSYTGAYCNIGVCNSSLDLNSDARGSGDAIVFIKTGTVYDKGPTKSGTAIPDGGILGLAVDTDARTLISYVNGVQSGNYALPAAAIFPFYMAFDNTASGTGYFSNSVFKYGPPAGYPAWG